MKMTFKDKWREKEEKAILRHILFEFWRNYSDPLGCEPACRNPKSSGCEECINRWLDDGFEKGEDLPLALMFGNVEAVEAIKILKIKTPWDYPEEDESNDD